MTDIVSVIKLLIDQNSANNTKRQIVGVEKTLADLAPTTKSAIRSIQRDFASLRDDLQDAKHNVDDVSQSLEKLDNKTVRPVIDVQSRGGVSASDATGRFGTAFSSIGGLETLGNAGGAFGEIGQIADVIEGTINLTRDLGPAGVVAAGGLVLLTSALAEFQKQAEITSAKAKEAFGAIEQAADLLARDATSAEIKDAITLREQEAESIRIQAAQYQTLLDNLDTAKAGQRISEISAAVQEIRDAGFGTPEELRQQITQLEVNATGADRAVRELNAALTDERTIAADAAALQEQRNREIVDGINRRTQAELEAQNFLTSATTETSDERLAAILREKVALVNANVELLQQNNAAADAQALLNVQRLEELSIIESMVQNAQPFLTILEGVKGVIGGVADGIQQIPKVTDGFKREIDDISKATKAIDDLNKQSGENIAKIRTDLAEKETEIIQRGGEKANELAEKFQVDQQQAQEDYYDELRKIQRQFNRENATTIGERDALAAFIAKQNAKDQQDDLKEQTDKETRRKQEGYNQQLGVLSRSIEDQLRTARAGAQKQLNLEYERYQKELQVKQQALQVEQQQFNNYLSGIINAGSTGYASAYNQFVNFVGNLANAIPRQTTTITAPSTPTIGLPPTIGQQPTAASAGIVTGESGGSAGVNLSLTFAVTSRRQMFMEIENYLNQAGDELLLPAA